MTITLTREEAQQVLDALEKFPYGEGIKTILRNKLIAPDVMINGLTEQETAETMSVKGLTQPEPEPVAWMNPDTPMGVFARHKEGADNFGCSVPLYTAPPQRKEWQGLTDEERTYLAWESNNGPHCVAMTEAKLKEKNT